MRQVQQMFSGIKLNLAFNSTSDAVASQTNSSIKWYGVHITIEPNMIPGITDDHDEPDFFAPLQKWEEFLKTLSWKERIEFYNTLEIIVEQPIRLRLEKN